MQKVNREILSVLKQALDHYGFVDIPSSGESMFPFISAGNIARIYPVDGQQLRVGDIVLFTMQSEYLIGHRIVNMTTAGDRMLYLVKGDTNLTPDCWISQDCILGRLQVLRKHWIRISMDSLLARAWARLVVQFPASTRLFRFILRINKKFKRVRVRHISDRDNDVMTQLMGHMSKQGVD